MQSLLQEIETFCAANGLSESRFGTLALSDKNLVKQLRDGRRVWPETEGKVRRFMAGFVRSIPQDEAA